jgi:hypothetical protein
MLDGGASGGIKAGLNLGFINIYSGPQPATADLAATGTFLGKVSVNADGVTGLTFDAAAAGTISKAAIEAWKFNGAADGTAGWFRFYEPTDTPTSGSAVKARIDGSIATSGADMNLSNIAITTGAPNTVDVFTFTLPAQ